MTIKLRPPWDNPEYLMKRIEVDFKEHRDYSPEEWKKDNMKYYLAGPIDSAGKRDANLEAFEYAAEVLQHMHMHIVKPKIVEGEDYEWAIRKDIRDLLECDAIILLPGWPQSKGAKGELMIAMYLNMPVYFFNSDGVEKLISMNFT